MKIAITGGSGFIGRTLQDLLEKEGHECVIVDIRHDAPVDILNLPALVSAFAGCDAIYHLAAEHRDDVTPKSKYYEVNVRGARHVAAAADANGIKRIIFTSSFAVYGLDRATPDEKTPADPFNDYGQSKFEAEEVFQEWAARHRDVHLAIVRPVVVFGEENRGNVHNLIKQMASGHFLMVGDGRNRKSVAYVGNVAAFLHFCLNGDYHHEVFNYADSPDYSMNQFLDVICANLHMQRPALRLPLPLGLGAGYTFDALSRVTGHKFPISAVRVRKFCADTTCNAAKARLAGFVPPYTLDEGLARMIAHDFADKVKPAEEDRHAA